jgi:hypothetical protein
LFIYGLKGSLLDNEEGKRVLCGGVNVNNRADAKTLVTMSMMMGEEEENSIYNNVLIK